MNRSQPLLLYFCPSSYGGISAYAHHHCQALAEQGCRVVMLCPPGFGPAQFAYRRLDLLGSDVFVSRPRLLNRIGLASRLMHDAAVLDRQISRLGARHVLLANFSELLAPLWAWRFRRHRVEGVRFGAILHDPVRDYVVGPPWWHRWSIRQALNCLDEVFLHESIDFVAGADPFPNHLRVTVLPHGPFSLPEACHSRDEVRASLGIPLNAPLALCFGHLRDGKNLGLVLQALCRRPDLHLLIAGSEAPPAQRSSAHYRQVASSLGVGGRCHWLIGYVPDDEVAELFGAADLVLLTYAASFFSASGVLDLAVRHRLPVLASGGKGALTSAVDTYRLGLRIKPDSTEAIAEGLASFPHSYPCPDWSGYARDHSWSVNASLCLQAMGV